MAALSSIRETVSRMALAATVAAASNLHAAGQRALRAAVVLMAAGTTWVIGGVMIRGALMVTPARVRPFAGQFDLGEYTFDARVFVPMMMWTALLSVFAARALIEVWRGRDLSGALQFWR